MHEHARVHHSTNSDISSVPGLYLMAHGIELSIKAFLLGNGMTVGDLRKLGQNGHDLVEALNAAVSRGLDCELSDDQGKLAALAVLNDSYSIKDFEYIITGATRWPRFSVISAVACKLYNTIAASIGYSKTLTPLSPV